MNKFPKRSFALEFHENTKIISSNQSFDPRIQYKIYPNSKTIELKKINNYEDKGKKGGFIETLLSRKSTRSFAENSISFDQLSQLLTLSFGLRSLEFSDENFRTYASAGARYPIEVYPVVLQSNDIERGIYHYNVVDNSLELIKTGDYTNQIHGFYKNQQFVSQAPCVIFFSMVFERSMMKYGERGYRFIFLDAGHMSQNLYLTAEYLGLGATALGGGMNNDDEIGDLIGLVHEVENIFYGFAIG